MEIKWNPADKYLKIANSLWAHQNTNTSRLVKVLTGYCHFLKIRSERSLRSEPEQI